MPHRSEAAAAAPDHHPGGADASGRDTVAATIWVVDLALSPSRLERCAGLLDAVERARSDRFLRAEDRDRYTVSHAALRLILGRALDCAPEAVRFGAGASGKPELAGPGRGAIDFNLSHSGPHGLVGLARGAAVGVDVEVCRPLPDALRIARGHFAPDEAAALAGLVPEAIEPAFFGLWTRKQARVEGLGAGVSLPLDRFSVSLPPAPPRLLRMAGKGEGGWSLAEIDVGPGAAATAAVRTPDAAITVRRLPADWADAPS